MPSLRRRGGTAEPETPPVEVPATPDRVAPREGANHLVVITLDSLRWDVAVEAGMPNLERLAPLEQRWSYASWTAPSHYNLLMGLLPHTSPTHVYASEYYKRDFARFTERLGVPGIEFKDLLPSIYLPTYLRATLGYETRAMVSMPVLNPATVLNRDFDDYALMPRHNDFAGMVDRLDLKGDRPIFQLLNVGETHYPYALPDEDPSEWPRISGVHGVFKHLDEQMVGGQLADEAEGFFDEEQLRRLRARQVRAAKYADDVLGRLYDIVPPGTWIVVTADHGELFGEAGYFGHGPVAHDKVFEVPFAEGRIR